MNQLQVRSNTMRQSQHINSLHRAILNNVFIDNPNVTNDGSYYSIQHQFDEERVIEISTSRSAHLQNRKVVYAVVNSGPMPSPEDIEAIYDRAELFGHFFHDFGYWLNIRSENDYNTFGNVRAISRAIETADDEVYDFIKLYEGDFEQRVSLINNAGGLWGELPSYTFSLRAVSGSQYNHEGFIDYPILCLRITEALLMDYLEFYKVLAPGGKLFDQRAERYRSRNLMMHDLLRIFK